MTIVPYLGLHPRLIKKMTRSSGRLESRVERMLDQLCQDVYGVFGTIIALPVARALTAPLGSRHLLIESGEGPLLLDTLRREIRLTKHASGSLIECAFFLIQHEAFRSIFGTYSLLIEPSSTSEVNSPGGTSESTSPRSRYDKLIILVEESPQGLAGEYALDSLDGQTSSVLMNFASKRRHGAETRVSPSEERSTTTTIPVEVDRPAVLVSH